MTIPTAAPSGGSFDKALAFVIAHEGTAFTDDPHDPGGPTKFGISLRFIRNDTLEPEDLALLDHDQDAVITWRDVQALTKDLAARIYRRCFWTRLHLDMMTPRLALTMFDSAVNVGRSRATRWLQEALGDVIVDGILGSQTTASVADFLAHSRNWVLAEHVLVSNVICRRRAYYLLLASPIQGREQFWASRYLNGWLNRLRDLEAEVKQA